MTDDPHSTHYTLHTTHYIRPHHVLERLPVLGRLVLPVGGEVSVAVANTLQTPPARAHCRAKGTEGPTDFLNNNELHSLSLLEQLLHTW